jgi:hypothetical protein
MLTVKTQITSLPQIQICREIRGAMFLSLRQVSVWVLIILWTAIVSLGLFILVNPVKAQGCVTTNGFCVPPAPTLIWQDPKTPANQYYIQGLTKNNTRVVVRLNGVDLPGIKIHSGNKGVSSFAVALPDDLNIGVYEVVAVAVKEDQQSLPSQSLVLVVEGTAIAHDHLALR